MADLANIIVENGYLVNGDTKEKIVWYECDPTKNTECDKTMCRANYNVDDASYGFCAKTSNKKYAKNGGKAWYAVLKTPEYGEPYWGREYI